MTTQTMTVGDMNGPLGYWGPARHGATPAVKMVRVVDDAPIRGMARALKAATIADSSVLVGALIGFAAA